MTFEFVRDAVVHKMSDTIASISPLAPPLIMSSGVPRAPGLHLTQITNDLFYNNHRNDADTKGNERMAFGFAWEHVMSWAIGQVFHQSDIGDTGLLIHPGEVQKDGILMSPDAVWVYDGVFEEWKATWKTGLKTPIDFTPWLWQTKAYGHAMGTNSVRLRVFHVGGTYRKPCPRCNDGDCRLVHTWVIEYTDEELADNWAMVLSHAEDRGWWDRKTGRPTPLGMGEA